MTRESREWTTEKCLRSAQVNGHNFHRISYMQTFEFNNDVKCCFLMDRWSLKTDVPTQRVRGIIKRGHLFEQFVGQPVILIFGTELQTCLLIFSR